MFRLEHNVPNVYVNDSRDFQLLCRVFDLQFGYLKFFVDSIENVNDTKLINDSLLPLMQTKLGFFTNTDIPSYQLRTILEGFSSIVKNKGSLAGVKQAVFTFLKIINIATDVYIIQDYQNYQLKIGFGSSIHHKEILKEILKYVMPTGFNLEIFVYYKYKDIGLENYLYNDQVNVVYIPIVQNSSVRLNAYAKLKDVFVKQNENYYSSIDSTIVAGNVGDNTYQAVYYTTDNSEMDWYSFVNNNDNKTYYVNSNSVQFTNNNQDTYVDDIVENRLVNSVGLTIAGITDNEFDSNVLTNMADDQDSAYFFQYND